MGPTLFRHPSKRRAAGLDIIVPGRLRAVLVGAMTAAFTGMSAMAAPLVMYSTAFSSGEGYAVGGLAAAGAGGLTG